MVSCEHLVCSQHVCVGMRVLADCFVVPVALTVTVQFCNHTNHNFSAGPIFKHYKPPRVPPVVGICGAAGARGTVAVSNVRG